MRSLIRSMLASSLAFALPVQAGAWKFVTEGDCPGTQVIGSSGELPDDALCTPEFAGKTALCFPRVCNPGCQYIDQLTTRCAGGGELAHVYTCEPEPAPVPVAAEAGGEG